MSWARTRHLLSHGPVGGNEAGEQARLDQSHRSVAEIGSRERLSDQVGKLGDLERPFVGSGVMKSPTDHEAAVVVGESLRSTMV